MKESAWPNQLCILGASISSCSKCHFVIVPGTIRIDWERLLNASPLKANLILPSMPPPNHLNCSRSSLVLLWGWSIHGAIPTLRSRGQRPSTSLHPVRVDAGCRSRVIHAHACLVSTLEVDVLDVEGVDMT